MQKNATHIKIGMLGFGFMGKTHLYSVNNIKFFYNTDELGYTAEVTSICTAHTSTAEEATRLYYIPHAYTCEDDIINDPNIDIIDICTPNIAHLASIKKALAAGKHVLCEKPLTVDANEAREVLALAKGAEARGLVCGTVFNNRFLSSVVRASQMIANGRIGRILSFNFTYYHDSCIDPSRSVGWKQTAEFGGGTLADLGPHVIDLCHMLVGRIARVSGRSQIAFSTHKKSDGSIWQTNSDEAFYMTAETLDGAIGNITVSKIAHGTSDGLAFEVYGTTGALKFDLMDAGWLYYYDSALPAFSAGGDRGWTRIECLGRYDPPALTFPTAKTHSGWLRGHIGSMAEYLRHVADGTPACPSFSDGVAVMSVIEAAHTSDVNGSQFTDVVYLD